jgi:ABC-type uncharacterized transport system permease subunit
MFNLRRTATYVLITTLAALALLYPTLMPGEYTASHVATAPARIKIVFVLLTALGLLIPGTLTRILFARLETLIESRATVSK